MKVDPSLQVEVKVNPYSRRQQIDKLRSRFVGGNLWQKRRLEDIYRWGSCLLYCCWWLKRQHAGWQLLTELCAFAFDNSLRTEDLSVSSVLPRHYSLACVMVFLSPHGTLNVGCCINMKCWVSWVHTTQLSGQVIDTIVAASVTQQCNLILAIAVHCTGCERYRRSDVKLSTHHRHHGWAAGYWWPTDQLLR